MPSSTREHELGEPPPVRPVAGAPHPPTCRAEAGESHRCTCGEHRHRQPPRGGGVEQGVGAHADADEPGQHRRSGHRALTWREVAGPAVAARIHPGGERHRPLQRVLEHWYDDSGATVRSGCRSHRGAGALGAPAARCRPAAASPRPRPRSPSRSRRAPAASTSAVASGPPSEFAAPTQTTMVARRRPSYSPPRRYSRVTGPRRRTPATQSGSGISGSRTSTCPTSPPPSTTRASTRISTMTAARPR